MTYRKLLGSAAATALVCGAAHGTPLPGASVTGSIDLGSDGYTGDPAYRQTITGTGDYAQLLSGPHGSASEVVHIRTARSPRASIYETFRGLPINGYGGTASVGVTISDALEINGPSGVVNIHERDAGVFKMYSSYPNGRLLAASSSVQLTDVFSRGTSDQRYFGTGDTGSLDVRTVGAITTGHFATSGIYSVHTNMPYYVLLFLNSTGYISGGLGGGAGWIKSFVDPTFSIDPSTPNAGQYSLSFSPGVGNGGTSVPEPASFAALGLGAARRGAARRAARAGVGCRPRLAPSSGIVVPVLAAVPHAQDNDPARGLDLIDDQVRLVAMGAHRRIDLVAQEGRAGVFAQEYERGFGSVMISVCLRQTEPVHAVGEYVCYILGGSAHQAIMRHRLAVRLGVALRPGPQRARADVGHALRTRTARARFIDECLHFRDPGPTLLLAADKIAHIVAHVAVAPGAGLCLHPGFHQVGE